MKKLQTPNSKLQAIVLLRNNVSKILQPTAYGLFNPRSAQSEVGRSKRGFTLIEILISSAIFTAIVVLTVGTFTDSLSLNGLAVSDRIGRQASRAFIEYITRQTRQSSTTTFTVSKNVYKDSAGAVPAFDFNGSGFFIFKQYMAMTNGGDPDHGKMQLIDPALPRGAAGTDDNAIIIPLVNAGSNKWMFIGRNPSPGAANTGASTYVLLISQANAIDRFAAMSWTTAGQVLSTEVNLAKLAFYGINPQGVVFSSIGGVSSYNVPTQPYLTIVMQLTTKANPNNVTSYQTSITSRDYQFAYPSCSKGGC